MFGIYGACITLSVIFLELVLKYRLHNERLIKDPNSKWERIEKIDFTRVINDLYKHRVITNKEKRILNEFNIYTRNPYIHYNIRKIIDDMSLEKLSSFNIKTKEITEMENIDLNNYPQIWFSAKRVRDKKFVIHAVSFSISWANSLLSTK